MSDPTKPDMSLIPLKTLEEVAQVLKAGLKNGRAANDWQKADPALFFSALIRHLGEHQYGNVRDTESGYSHLAHAACNAIICLWHQQNGGRDERKDMSEDKCEAGGYHSLVGVFGKQAWRCCKCNKMYTTNIFKT